MQAAGKRSPHARSNRSKIGFVFQRFNLVPRLSVHANVLIGALAHAPRWRNLFGIHSRANRIRAMEALDSVGMANCAAQRAGTLSGGQMQRVAIARAIMQNAKLILADEPIASLDPKTATEVMELLARLGRETGATLLVSLHQIEYAQRYCDRIIALREGRIVHDAPTSDLNEDRIHALYHDQAARSSEPEADLVAALR